MKSCLAGLIVGILIFGGCSSPTAGEISPNGIVGKWKWAYTSHAWSGIEWPPTGHELIAIYTENGKYAEIVNGRVAREGTYISTTRTNGDGEVAYDGARHTEPYWIRHDTLNMGRPEVDGPLTVYVRTR